MRPLVLLVPVLLAAVELPSPSCEVHPDGARLVWSLSLPAGRHRLDLPAWSGPAIVVRGAAAWNRQEEAGVPPALPAAVTALLAERNRLAEQTAVLGAGRAALAAAERQWRGALTEQAAAGGVDAAAWQAGLDALLGERVRLDEAERQLAAARRELVARALAAGGPPAERALAGQGSLSAEALARAWAAAAGAGPQRAHLDLQLSAAGEVRIEEQRDDCWWRSECDLRLAGGTALLLRRAVLVKPAAVAPGRVVVTASAAPLTGELAAPSLPRVELVAEPVEAELRKLVSGGRRTTSWDELEKSRGSVAAYRLAPPAATVAGKAAPSLADAASVGADLVGDGTAGFLAQRAGAHAARTAGAEAPPPLAGPPPASATFELGALDFAAGSERLVAMLGESRLQVITDEWALFPEDRPAALRRVTAQLDGRPLLPGAIRVVGEGQLPVEGMVPWVPGGGTLTVCAGIDERIVVVSSTRWDPRPGDDRRKRRREGLDTWLANATAAPVTVAVYRTMPVSTADEVRVEPDPDTTPGGTAVVPGLLRWQLTLPVGVPTRVGVGWNLVAGGSFTLE